MPYNEPQSLVYNFPEMDFGATAGDTVHRLAGPEGKKGRLKSVGVVATEEFLCDSTNAQIKVGTTSDDDAYALLNITDELADGARCNEADDTDAIIDADIPADGVVEVTLVEGTDGTGVTGKGYPYVIIDWY